MPGPQRARLDTALNGAYESAVEASSAEWEQCVSHLQLRCRKLLLAAHLQ